MLNLSFLSSVPISLAKQEPIDRIISLWDIEKFDLRVGISVLKFISAKIAEEEKQ